MRLLRRPGVQLILFRSYCISFGNAMTPHGKVFMDRQRLRWAPVLFFHPALAWPENARRIGNYLALSTRTRACHFTVRICDSVFAGKRILWIKFF